MARLGYRREPIPRDPKRLSDAPAPRGHNPDVLWEERPHSLIVMDFRGHEAEMAAQRAASNPPRSVVNVTPGARVHDGWMAGWLTDRAKMQQKFQAAVKDPGPVRLSRWR